MKLRLALLFSFVFAWGLTYWELPAFDPDLGWQLFGGAWILENGAVPRADPINAFNIFWLDYHWLAQIVMFKLFAWGGFEALRIGLGLVMATFFVVLAATAFRASRNISIAIFVATGSYIFLSEVAQVRPQMLSLLLLAVAHQILSTGRGKRTTVVPLPHWKFELPALFFLTVILANFHVYWLFVPMLWVFYRVVPRMMKARAPHPRYAWGGLALLAAAPLLSPYGLFQSDWSLPSLLQNYLLILDYLDIPKVLKDSIFEFRSSFALGNIKAWMCAAYLIVIARSVDRVALRYRLGDLLSVVVALVLIFLGSKYIGVLAIFAVPFLAWSLRRALERWPVGDVVTRSAERLQVLIFSIGTVAALLYGVQFYPYQHANNEYIDTVEPFSLCKKLPDLPIIPFEGHKNVRVLTHFNHGGWCRFALYLRDPKLDFRVTTDNRTQAVPGYHYQQSFDLFGMKSEWMQTLLFWNPEVIVVDKKMAIANYLALAPGSWKLALQDDVFAVFLPVPK